uniref:Uncharacterized protein n=1 Tax=Cacopsylla melanoneura TaxID=428564 RepID=A0A8D8TKP8_9HEMI
MLSVMSSLRNQRSVSTVTPTSAYFHNVPVIKAQFFPSFPDRNSRGFCSIWNIKLCFCTEHCKNCIIPDWAKCGYAPLDPERRHYTLQYSSVDPVLYFDLNPAHGMKVGQV